MAGLTPRVAFVLGQVMLAVSIVMVVVSMATSQWTVVDGDSEGIFVECSQCDWLGEVETVRYMKVTRDAIRAFVVAGLFFELMAFLVTVCLVHSTSTRTKAVIRAEAVCTLAMLGGVLLASSLVLFHIAYLRDAARLVSPRLPKAGYSPWLTAAAALLATISSLVCYFSLHRTLASDVIEEDAAPNGGDKLGSDQTAPSSNQIREPRRSVYSDSSGEARSFYEISSANFPHRTSLPFLRLSTPYCERTSPFQNNQEHSVNSETALTSHQSGPAAFHQRKPPAEDGRSSRLHHYPSGQIESRISRYQEPSTQPRLKAFNDVEEQTEDRFSLGRHSKLPDIPRLNLNGSHDWYRYEDPHSVGVSTDRAPSYRQPERSHFHGSQRIERSSNMHHFSPSQTPYLSRDRAYADSKNRPHSSYYHNNKNPLLLHPSLYLHYQTPFAMSGSTARDSNYSHPPQLQRRDSPHSYTTQSLDENWVHADEYF